MTWLNMAWLVLSSMVLNLNLSSMVFVTHGWVIWITGTRLVSFTSWYVLTNLRLVRGAETLYVIEVVTSVRSYKSVRTLVE